MANTFDPRTYKSGRPATNRLNTAKSVYGSTKAGDFLSDVIAGRDSLDVIVVGDSNTGFSSTGAAAGWVYGWEYWLMGKSAKPYATAVYPCAGASATNTIEGKRSALATDGYQNRSTGQSGGTSFVTLGSASGITSITNLMNSGSGNFKPHSVGVDWAYTAAGTNQQDNLYIEIGANSTLGVKNSFVYRTVFATFPTGSGSFRQIAHQNGAGPIATGTRVNTNYGSYGYDVASMTLPADSNRTGLIRFCRAGGGWTALDNGIYGPCGFLLESVYTPRKGFAVTSMGYYGGGTTTQIKDGIVNSGETITTYLKEMRLRQIAAGGSGRVLVFIHSGANDGAGITSWTASTALTIQAFQNKWAQLNFPQSDLCFVAMVSHPNAEPDGMLSARIASKTVTASISSDNVTTLYFNEIGLDYSGLTGRYDSGGTAHLLPTGYEFCADLAFSQLVST